MRHYTFGGLLTVFLVFLCWVCENHQYIVSALTVIMSLIFLAGICVIAYQFVVQDGGYSITGASGQKIWIEDKPNKLEKFLTGATGTGTLMFLLFLVFAYFM